MQEGTSTSLEPASGLAVSGSWIHEWRRRIDKRARSVEISLCM